jgi:hypothetical protein
VFKNIGHPGGTTFDAKVSTDHKHWFWSADKRDKGTRIHRRLNWFGEFNEDAGLQIIVEINTPYEGRNDQIAGFFARDTDNGAVYLFHSGRVGGGKKGVGKITFLTWSDEELTEVADSSGDIRSGILVMPVAGRSAIRSAVRYVDTVARFKEAARSGETNTPEFQDKERQYRDFYSEPRGHRSGRRTAKIDFVSRHGDVLDAVKAWRSLQPIDNNARLVKNVLFDLGVAKGNELIEVYEIKTDTARSLIYAAIGQLMVHGIGPDCQRVLVLPDRAALPDDLEDALQRLQIKLLRFRLNDDKATIICLNSAVAPMARNLAHLRRPSARRR